jgi:hypothetical protein
MSAAIGTHMRRRGAVLTFAATLALAVPAVAQATAPTVSTGKASAVSFSSATFGGSVNPKGADTSYYFQYGLTKGYGLQTTILGAGAGTHGVPVAIAVGGLQPLTVYHFRLVAVNASGATIGADKTFLTKKVPLSLAILASPNPVIWGGAITVQGSLSGTGNGNREVVLQANAFPFTAGFVNAGNAELTTATGGFSFAVLGLTEATQYRVVTTTNPPVVSPIATEGVAVRIKARMGRIGPRGKALFFGTVSPALDGEGVAIMHETHGHEVFVKGSILRHATATSSKFSRVVAVKRGGVYHVLVHFTSGPYVSTYSAPLIAR